MKSGLAQCVIGQAQYLTLFYILAVHPCSGSADEQPMRRQANQSGLDDLPKPLIVSTDASRKQDIVEIGRKRKSWCGQPPCFVARPPVDVASRILAANDTNDGKQSAVRGKQVIDASKGRFDSDSRLSDVPEADVEPFDFSLVPEARKDCEYPGEESGFVVHIRTFPYLNPDLHGNPSPIVLAMFQLSDIGYVRNIAGGSDGLSVLFGRPKHESILAIETISLRSGTHDTYTLDRHEGARHLMIVAGFRSYEPSKGVRIYLVPTKKDLFSKGCRATRLEVQLQVSHRSLR